MDQDFNRFSVKATVVSCSFVTLMAIYVSTDPQETADIYYVPHQKANDDLQIRSFLCCFGKTKHFSSCFPT